MSFFARPDLSNEQFKQLSGSTLTLSGTTQIATVSGLTLTDGSTGSIVVTAEGAGVGLTDYHVLTFDPVDSRIKLMDMGSGSTGFYTGNSPATIDLGGITGGTTLTGKTISEILEDLLTPTVESLIIVPSQSFTINPTDVIYEFGFQLPLTGTTCFSRGSVSPVYNSLGSCVCASGPRSGVVFGYNYIGLGGNVFISSSLCCSTRCINPIIQLGANTWTNQTYYCSGDTVYNSSGGIQLSGLSSGFTNATRTVCGILPFFYGTVASGSAPAGDNRPTPTTICSCIGAECGKVVNISTGTISINFGSTSDDYIWFAIPNASTSKTCWFINALNNGLIGGVVSAGGNLFPDFDSVTGVTTTLWSGQTYKLYISNYQTAVNTAMQLRNS